MIKVGDRVRVISTGRVGTVEAINEDMVRQIPGEENIGLDCEYPTQGKQR